MPLQVIFHQGYVLVKKFAKVLELIFLNVFANTGPARITVGMAMIRPYNKVSPMLALNCATRLVGAGCGGKNPCVTDNAAIIGNPV